MRTANLFERLLNASNDVLNNWIDAGSPHSDAMIELHCAAKALDHCDLQFEVKTNWRDDPNAIVEDDEPQVGRDYA